MSTTSTSNGVDIKNMRLIGHSDLGGFANGGEGMGLQKTPDGRRIMYIAHECAPINFTVVDVSDPSKPQVVTQTKLPHNEVRSNSLDLVGDTLAVAYQTQKPGLQPAGVELFDVSNPANPRSISFFDRSGPHSQGAHYVGFVDGEFMHISSGAPDFTPTHPKDHQFYTIVDVRNPTKPEEVGRWWMPGQWIGGGETASAPITSMSTHSVQTAPMRPISTAASSFSTSPTRRIPR